MRFDILPLNASFGRPSFKAGFKEENAPEGSSPKSSPETSVKILNAVKRNPEVSIPQLADFAGVTTRSIERNIRKLQDVGKLRRIGPDKGGH